MTQVSHQQCLTPVEPLREWVEEFGHWTISDGLENPGLASSRQYAAAAAAWLLVAGSDIHSDATWGRGGIVVHNGKLWQKKLAAGRRQETRWGFWKERLLEISGDDSYDEATREAVKQAEQSMNKI